MDSQESHATLDDRRGHTSHAHGRRAEGVEPRAVVRNRGPQAICVKRDAHARRVSHSPASAYCIFLLLGSGLYCYGSHGFKHERGDGRIHRGQTQGPRTSRGHRTRTSLRRRAWLARAHPGYTVLADSPRHHPTAPRAVQQRADSRTSLFPCHARVGISSRRPRAPPSASSRRRPSRRPRLTLPRRCRRARRRWTAPRWPLRASP